MLLRLERVHLDRHFRRSDHVGQEHERPPAELRAVAEVEIFGERIVLPAACVGDGLAAPHAGRAVEVEEAPCAIAGAVLEHEVAVEQDRLNFREERVVLIDVPPARLHHADIRIGEMREQAVQEVWRRQEVGVEDADVAAARHLQSGFERAGLVARAVGAMEGT